MACATCGFPAIAQAARCAFCGATLTPAACGTHLASDDDWEYRELVVPLGLKVRPGHLAVDDQRRIQETIGRYLRQAAAAGWEPAVDTDWRSLRSHGYARRRVGPSLGSGATLHYESVRVPLRRHEPR